MFVQLWSWESNFGFIQFFLVTDKDIYISHQYFKIWITSLCSNDLLAFYMD